MVAIVILNVIHTYMYTYDCSYSMYLYNFPPLSGFQVRVIVESGGQNATVTLDVIWYCMVCLVSALETLHEVTQ